MFNILVACEESQAVTKAFRNNGFNAYSCDILPCSGGHPEWHFKGDVRTVLSRVWDMVIAFPPCTHLASSGAAHFKKKQADGRQQEAIDFFMQFVNLDCKYKAIENPIGIMSTKHRTPDQIIHPYMFGDPVQKATCLWLTGLPCLVGNTYKPCIEYVNMPSGKRMSKWYYDTSCLPHAERPAARSKTFPGIAQAMADQWGRFLICNNIIK